MSDSNLENSSHINKGLVNSFQQQIRENILWDSIESMLVSKKYIPAQLNYFMLGLHKINNLTNL